MRLSKFPAGMKPLQSDLNAIGENMEDAFHSLLKVFSGNSEGVLFDALTPVVVVNGDVISITTPGQNVGIGGAVLYVKDYVEAFSVDDGASGQLDLQVEIYFVFRRAPITAVRSFLSVDPTRNVTILQNSEAEVATTTNASVVYLWSNTIGGSSQLPALGPNDIGYIKLATVRYDGNATITEEPNSKFTLPQGVVVPVQGHGSQHMPGGSDPLDLAVLTNTIISGSTAGLMPEGALWLATNAIIDVVPTAESPYLQFATSGTNTVVNSAFEPRLVQATLKTDNSLAVTSVQGAPALGVRFGAKSATTGVSDLSSRKDHIHALSESGLVVVNLTETMTTGVKGTLLSREITAADLPLNVRLAQILDVKYYWEPPNLSAINSHDDNLLSVPWNVSTINGSLQTIGIRTNILSKSSFQMEIGTAGLIYLTPIMESEVQSWTSPQYGHGTFPDVGTIHIVVLGLREGANG